MPRDGATPLPTERCDLLVVGSGAGGLSTAVTAAHLGLKVIVIEKEGQFGGTTAWSGGWMWVPRNPLAVAAGIFEPIDAPLAYLRHELGDQFSEGRARKFLETAPRMVDFFRASTALQFVDGNAIPDFHGNTPHAATGGRSLCAAPFDGRNLGTNIKQLKPPLAETTLWGMGIASGADIRQFFNAMRSLGAFVYVTKRVLRHLKDVVLHGRGMHLVNGNALVAALAKSAFDMGIEIRVSSTAKRILREGNRVVGAVVAGAQGELEIRASRGVVLACGGFPHDVVRKAALLPHAPTGTEHWSAASRGNTGDGLRLGEAAGGSVITDLLAAVALAPVSLVPRSDGSVAHFPHLLERAKPGLIAVTANGKRFTNEANSYYDFITDLLATLPTQQPKEAWLVCAHAFVRRWGLGAVKPAPMSMRAMLRSGYLKRGNSVAELALQCGIDPLTLGATLTRYNAMARNGKDQDFAKGDTLYNRIQGDASHTGPNPCMAPIDVGPFYAVKVVPGSLGTFAGLRTNDDAQVLDGNGNAIEGLYANGNDMSSMMGGRYPSGGITLGPAMTFGYLAAHRAAGVCISSPPTKAKTPMFYELATMTLPFGTAGQAATNVQTYCANTEAKGELLGCWFTDIGTLNQMIVMRGFVDRASLDAERTRTQKNADPFGCGGIYQTLEQHSYEGFAWMKPVRPSAESGISGPVYEIRTYGIKTGGLQPTIDLWEQYLPARDKLSPCIVAMVALDGPLRFTNIWAYPSIDARSKARADAVAHGIWPPKGGPSWLTTNMTSSIAMPTAISPLK